MMVINDENSFIDSIIAKLKGENKPKGATMPFIDSLNNWANENRPSLRANTYKAYDSVIRNHIAPFFTRETPLMLADINRPLLQEFVNQMIANGKSYSLIRKALREVISPFLKQMESDRSIDRNPAPDVKMPKEPKTEIEVPPPEELRKILSAIPDNDPWKIAVYLMAFTGLRRGEMLGLKWDKVDLEHGLLYIHRTNTATAGEKTQVKDTTKNKFSYRVIPLSPFILELLKKHRERQGECEYVIHLRGRKRKDNPKGGADQPVDPNNFRRKWVMWLRDAGIRPLHIHSLRHFYVTMCRNAGLTGDDIKDNAGWGSTRMLGRYTDNAQRVEARRGGQNLITDYINKVTFGA